jgi:hypothetical protein
VATRGADDHAGRHSHGGDYPGRHPIYTAARPSADLLWQEDFQPHGDRADHPDDACLGSGYVFSGRFLRLSGVGMRGQGREFFSADGLPMGMTDRSPSLFRGCTSNDEFGKYSRPSGRLVSAPRCPQRLGWLRRLIISPLLGDDEHPVLTVRSESATFLR